MAEKYNDKIAYSDEESSLTFLQVKSLAQSIGSALIERGADGNPIAVFSDRSVMTVAAFLGVVYSGCSYAPIDSKLPRARIEKIMETGSARRRRKRWNRDCHGNDERAWL